MKIEWEYDLCEKPFCEMMDQIPIDVARQFAMKMFELNPKTPSFIGRVK
jgi:hypothetical protein